MGKAGLTSPSLLSLRCLCISLVPVVVSVKSLLEISSVDKLNLRGLFSRTTDNLVSPDRKYQCLPLPSRLIIVKKLSRGKVLFVFWFFFLLKGLV